MKKSVLPTVILMHRNNNRRLLTPMPSMKYCLLSLLSIFFCVLYIQPIFALKMSKSDFLTHVSSGNMLLKYQHDRQQKSTIEYTTALLLNSSAMFEINGLVATITLTLTQSFLNKTMRLLRVFMPFLCQKTQL